MFFLCSSSSTVLAYGSDTLFISNRGSNVVYTISSDLSSVGDSQDMAVGYIQFFGGTLENIRDITIASRDSQPLSCEPTALYIYLVVKSIALSLPLSSLSLSPSLFLSPQPPSQ